MNNFNRLIKFLYKMEELIISTKQELRTIIKTVLAEYDKEKASKAPTKVYSINQVAKLLGKSYNTIKKYVDKGIIKSTTNGLITESAINEYLGQ